MKPVLVWDIPTRMFHWLLAAGCIVALALALGAPEHSWAFDIHMLFGLFLIPLLIFRLVWGVMGTTYAQFRSFLYRPRDALDYMVGMIAQKSPRYLGHNPAASYAILAMLVLAPGCVITGLIIPSSKFFEELHEVLAYILLGIVGAHLLGVLVHTVVHRENVILSMLTGTKMAKEGEGISSAHPLIALFILLLTGTWSATIVKNYDFSTRRLVAPLSGAFIQLGKSEKHPGDLREPDED